MRISDWSSYVCSSDLKGRHAVARRQAVLRQGERMEPDLRGQPRPARQSRPDPARPGAEDPAAGRLTGARRIPFPITDTLHDTPDPQYRHRPRPTRYDGAGRSPEDGSVGKEGVSTVN